MKSYNFISISLINISKAAAVTSALFLFILTSADLNTECFKFCMFLCIKGFLSVVKEEPSDVFVPSLYYRFYFLLFSFPLHFMHPVMFHMVLFLLSFYSSTLCVQFFFIFARFSLSHSLFACLRLFLISLLNILYSLLFLCIIYSVLLIWEFLHLSSICLPSIRLPLLPLSLILH